MIKKTACIFLSLVMAVAAVSFSGIALNDNQFDATVSEMGDVNSDNEININDVLAMRKVFSNERFASMNYENADLNGDSKSSLIDLLLLRKHLAGYDVEISNDRFLKADKDITSELEDLGKNNFDDNYNPWTDSTTANTYSRNPYDMLTVGGRVLVSGGNYQDNTGPVKITYYARDYAKSRSAGTVGTEQVNRFYSYDGLTFALAIDTCNWGSGDLYVMKENGYSFTTRSAVFSGNIHCYDMTKYNDKFYFAGSSVGYDSNIKGYSGGTLEMSKSVIYRFKGEDITKATREDFEEVELVDKNGNVVDFTTQIKSGEKLNGEIYYMSLGVPRIYDIFEFDGELYALYYDHYASWYDETYGYNGKYNFNGLYQYNSVKDQFIYNPNLKIDGMTEFFEESQDLNKVTHDFEWNGKFYIISDTMISTDDFINYEAVVIDGYEGYNVRDVIVRSGKLYFLCNKTVSGGNYVNYILETEDMENFRPILHFSSATFARSFEISNGAFFFGLGADYDENYINTECGRIYRYIYYK